MELSVLLVTGVIFGIGIILLVSGELSQKLGLSKASRYILAGFLGFGVMGLSVKAVAIILLQSNVIMKEAVDASRQFGDHAYSGSVVTKGLIYPARGRHWRALPEDEFVTAQNENIVELGRWLFFDRRLSSTQTVSCASCHVIGLGGDDGTAVSTGIEGKKGSRNAPTVLNTVFLKRLFWDGRAKSLEDQALGPLLNPVEMGLKSPEDVMERVKQDPRYVAMYQAAFGKTVAVEGIVAALAAFERTLVTLDAPYDRFVRGDKTALSPKQLKGMDLFDKIGCRTCHRDPFFTVAGEKRSSPFRPFPVFKNSAYVQKYNLTDDKGIKNRGVWRVPSLRNVALTAPYFHNGMVTKLSDAVKVMATAQLGLKISDKPDDDVSVYSDRDNRVTLQSGRALDSGEIDNLVAFLESLSGTPPLVENPWEKN